MLLLLVLTALILATPFGSAGQCLASLSMIILLGFIFPKTVGIFLQDSRFKTPPPWKTAIALTILDLTVTFGLVLFWGTLIALYFPDYLARLEVFARETPAGTIEQVFIFISGAIFVPLYEEFAFRGVALRAYERARSPIYAALLTSFIFALVHGTLIQLLAFIPGSFLLARCVQNRGSWWLAVIPHVVNNGLIFGVFPFLPPELEEEDPQLIVGILALIIAMIAFAIAAHWLKVFRVKKAEINLKTREFIWTPALMATIFFGIYMAIFTTFAPLDSEQISRSIGMLG
ncbi:type II CAAX endopeptidase family protein [Spirulina sp. 06S082]|uniref:CPBP family intramembrane glutamic endopeptidase n=1 Tax=Spirulina sp. 06S082 TaxID=3110248 RepID=UPI002B214A32|nr:type II CAAX endopeptidase family protein [Spirulina sp. 06S082]MEA5468023.1 type II CAAX endopeptidase family protein [Spirulina sp. 06S082]